MEGIVSIGPSRAEGAYEVTEVIPEGTLLPYMRDLRKAGGFLRTAGPCTYGGKPAHVVTAVFR